MKRLVWVFAILLAIAFGAALLGYALRAHSSLVQVPPRGLPTEME